MSIIKVEAPPSAIIIPQIASAAIYPSDVTAKRVVSDGGFGKIKSTVSPTYQFPDANGGVA
tara:strand:+ start:427 stop:609 length:183 start_codon:yes stop_codon:yes gene_type:complete